MRKPTRKEIWHHNSLLGRAAQARSMCVVIQQTATTTEESQALSMEIGILVSRLISSLRTRRDHEESTWKVVGVDNHARESVADILMSEGHTKATAQTEVERLNSLCPIGDFSGTYYMIYPASQRLSKGMADLV